MIFPSSLAKSAYSRFKLDESIGKIRLTDEEAAADASLIVVAATDTSVQAVITFLRYIAYDTSRRRKLQKEIDSVFINIAGDDELDTQALERLEFLDACIQESLRIIPPGPFGRCHEYQLLTFSDKWN